MRKALDYIVSRTVENPEKIQISEHEEEGVVTFTIKVAKEDMGRIIGKEGKIIRAIRNVLKIPAMKQNKKVQVTLAEEE